MLHEPLLAVAGDAPEQSLYASTMAIPGGLEMTTSRDVLEALSTGNGPRRVLVTLGYSSWGEGQLESELGENSWLTVRADPAVGGEASGFVVLINDITERRRTEQEVRQLNEELERRLARIDTESAWVDGLGLGLEACAGCLLGLCRVQPDALNGYRLLDHSQHGPKQRRQVTGLLKHSLHRGVILIDRARVGGARRRALEAEGNERRLATSEIRFRRLFEDGTNAQLLVLDGRIWQANATAV